MTSTLEHILHNSKNTQEILSLKLDIDRINEELFIFEKEKNIDNLEYQGLLIQKENIIESIDRKQEDYIPNQEEQDSKIKKVGKVLGHSLLNTISKLALIAAGTVLISYNLPPIADARAERRIEHFQEERGTNYIGLFDGQEPGQQTLEDLNSLFTSLNQTKKLNLTINNNAYGFEHIISYLDKLVYTKTLKETTINIDGKKTLNSEGTINEYLYPDQEAEYRGIDLTKGKFLLYVDVSSNNITSYNISIVPQGSSNQMNSVAYEPNYNEYVLNTRNVVELYDLITHTQESGIYMLNTIQINDKDAQTPDIGFEIKNIILSKDGISTASPEEEKDYLDVVLYHLNLFKNYIYDGTVDTFLGSVNSYIETNKLPITFNDKLKEEATRYYDAIQSKNLGK